VSKVSILNLAYAGIGHKAFIQSIDEASVEARYGKLYYDVARRATLRAHPWNFATVRVNLALLGDGPAPWTYMYVLPTGCVKARYIVSSLPGVKIPFEVGLSADGTTRVLYTNQEDAVLVFTFDVENDLLFDATFIDAFAFGLAYRLAPTIAPSKSQEAATKFMNAMRMAQAADASEGEAEEPAAPDWLEARLGGTPEYYLRYLGGEGS